MTSFGSQENPQHQGSVDHSGQQAPAAGSTAEAEYAAYAQQYAAYAEQMQNMMTPAGVPMGGMTPEMMQMMQMQQMQQMQTMYDPATAVQHHHIGLSAMQHITTGFNSMGLPIREGAQTCSYFSNYGECKFGPACKYNHPESYTGFAAARQEAAALAASTYGSDATLIPLIGTGPPTTVVNSLGYPIRPGQTACSFFSRTGVCRYASTCKWDHPEEFCALATTDMAKNLLPKVEVSGFNTSGYPIRPGAESCSFYLKTGGCKFGPSCKWDHPEGMGGTKQDSRTPMRQPPNPPPMVTDAEVAYAAVTSAQGMNHNRAAPY